MAARPANGPTPTIAITPLIEPRLADPAEKRDGASGEFPPPFAMSLFSNDSIATNPARDWSAEGQRILAGISLIEYSVDAADVVIILPSRDSVDRTGSGWHGGKVKCSDG